MVGWLKLIVTAAAVMAGLWTLLVVLAARLPAGLWVLSPIDLLPEFLPVIGPLDDVVVVALALRYAARRGPPPGAAGGLAGRPAAAGTAARRRGARHPSARAGSPTRCAWQALTPSGPGSDIPLGVAVMAYKAILGLSEIVVGVLLAATVALLLPFDVRQAIIDPTAAHVLLAVANAAVLAALVLLLLGRLPRRPVRTRTDDP